MWGVAYKINENNKEVKSLFDVREKRYQNRPLLEVYNKDGVSLKDKALVFVGTDQKELILGPASLDDIAHQIANSSGASGENSEYLFNLAKFLREETLNGLDDHVKELEKLVSQIKN